MTESKLMLAKEIQQTEPIMRMFLRSLTDADPGLAVLSLKSLLVLATFQRPSQQMMNKLNMTSQLVAAQAHFKTTGNSRGSNLAKDLNNIIS